MRVVDTNILASVLVDGPFSADARTLLARDADWHSEAFILVELSNVMLTQVRARRCTLSVALQALALGTATLHGRLHDVAHADALTAADRHAVSAYDARYLAVAELLHERLITEDAALRRKAPAMTQSLAEALDG